MPTLYSAREGGSYQPVVCGSWSAFSCRTSAVAAGHSSEEAPCCCATFTASDCILRTSSVCGGDEGSALCASLETHWFPRLLHAIEYVACFPQPETATTYCAREGGSYQPVPCGSCIKLSCIT